MRAQPPKFCVLLFFCLQLQHWFVRSCTLLMNYRLRLNSCFSPKCSLARRELFLFAAAAAAFTLISKQKGLLSSQDVKAADISEESIFSFTWTERLVLTHEKTWKWSVFKTMNHSWTQSDPEMTLSSSEAFLFLAKWRRMKAMKLCGEKRLSLFATKALKRCLVCQSWGDKLVLMPDIWIVGHLAWVCLSWLICHGRSCTW